MKTNAIHGNCPSIKTNIPVLGVSSRGYSVISLLSASVFISKHWSSKEHPAYTQHSKCTDTCICTQTAAAPVWTRVRCRRLQLSRSVRSISGFHQVCNWRQLNVEAFTADVDRSELIVCFRPATCSLRASVTTRRCGHCWTITCHCSWSVSDVVHLLLAMTVSVEMCATFARF